MNEVIKAGADILADDAFWADIEQRVKSAALANARKMVLQGAAAAHSAGVIVDLDAIHPQALAVTKAWSDDWWKQLNKATQAGLREALTQWESVGLGKRGLSVSWDRE